MKGIKSAVMLTALITVIALSFSSCVLVSLVWGGIRFSPEDAMEAVSLGSSKRARIEAEGCYFYYETLADCYEISAGSNLSDCICHVTPVIKNDVGMWHAVAQPRSYPVYVDGADEYVGQLVTQEAGGIYHNFFIPSFGGTNPPTFPDVLRDGYTAITVGGEDIELVKHSYFATEYAIEEFKINGVKLTVDN